MYLLGIVIIQIAGQLGFLLGHSDLGMIALLGMLAQIAFRLNDK